MSEQWQNQIPGVHYSADTRNMPADYADPNVKKVIVFMSDGAPFANQGPLSELTVNGNYYELYSETVARANFEYACTSIKDVGIEIYTVSFWVSRADDLERMRNCASSNSHFFETTGADEIRDAFNIIANNLDGLVLTH